MAQNGFYGAAEFAECAMILGDLEERIVTEAAAATRSEQDAAATIVFRFGAHVAERIGQYRVANVMSRSLLQRNVGEFLKQLGVVRLVRRVRSRKAGRVNAWPAIEDVDRQPAVFPQDPTAELPCLDRGL